MTAEYTARGYLEAGLLPVEKLTLIVMGENTPGGDGVVWASMEDMAERIGVTKEQLERVVHGLKLDGYIYENADKQLCVKGVGDV